MNSGCPLKWGTSHSRTHDAFLIVALSYASLIISCKPKGPASSSLRVVKGIEVKTQQEAQTHAPGAYGIQTIYKNDAGKTIMREGTGSFTDKGGTTFITNGHVMAPPSGFTMQSAKIVDYQGNKVQTVSPQTQKYINVGADKDASRDLAMWRFPDGTKNLPHGSAEFAPKGYDLEKEQLSIAGYGVDTNGADGADQYGKLRYGQIGTLYNSTGNTFGYNGPKLSSEKSDVVSSAPGDSGAPIYGTSGKIVGINRGGGTVSSDSDGFRSQAINPYSNGATSFFKQVKSQGGVVDGWQN